MTRNDPIKHVFIWPAVMVVLLISIFPLIYSLTTSFMSFRLVPPTPIRFVGVENYASLLANPRFWQVFATTSIIAFSAVTIQYVIGFGLALALHARVPGERLYRVGFLLPMLIAPVAAALIPG
jgi:multiple sugar transport system permease protein